MFSHPPANPAPDNSADQNPAHSGPVSVPDLRNQIKAATTLVHDKLDHNPLALGVLRPDVTIAEYRSYLERTLGFVEPLEEALARVDLPAELGINVAQRAKSHLIKEDLLKLGASPAEVAAIPRLQITDLAGVPEALGTLYVMEGSTMGGLVIAKHIQNTLGLDGTNGAGFLNCYGNPKSTVALFQDFVRVLNSFATTLPGTAGNPPAINEIKDREQRACGAAFDAFLAVDRWFSAP